MAALEAQIEEAPHQRAAQKRLAEEVTRLVHGEDALQNAIKASKALFGGDLDGLDEATLLDIFSDVPSTELSEGNLDEERPLLDVLVEASVFPSKGEAKRMVKNGGLYLSNKRIDDAEIKLSSTARTSETVTVVRKGKKKYSLLRFTK